MANANGSIDEIIGQEAIKQIDDATAKMGTLLTTFKESVTAVNLMNDALNKAGSGGSGLKKATNEFAEFEKVEKKLIETTRQYGTEINNLKVLTTQAAAQNKAQAQSTVALKGSYNELQANMQLLIAKYKALSAEMRSGAIGKGLQADIAMANKSLKDLDAGLGNMQRNVGNYGSALTKVWSGIRQIAYILPGLGIAGMFNLAFEAITSVVDAISSFTESISGAKTVLASAFDSPEMKTAIENNNKLSTAIDLVSKGTMSKSEALKLYNETLGKSAGKVKTWEEAEDKIKTKLPAYIKFITIKAQANAFLATSAQLAADAQKEIIDPSFLTKMEGLATAFRTGKGWGDAIESEARVKAGAKMELSKKYLEEFKKLYEDYNKVLKDNNLTDIPDKVVTEPKKPTVNRIDDLKKQMDDEIAVAKVKASQEYKTENELRQDILEIYKKYATKKLVAVKNLNKDEEHSSKQLGEQIVKDTQSIVEKQTAEINKQIKNDIDQHNRALKVKIKNNDERVKDEEKACDDIDKRNNKTFDKQKDDAEKLKKQREDDQKALMDSLQSMQNSTFDIANSISDAIFSKQMQQFDARDKALAESYKNELKFIEQSGFSSAEKEKMKAKLAAENEAKQKQIDRERVTALRKQAKLQKALDINQAIASTALAVLKALGDKTIETPYLRIANAVAAGLIGAAQIARVIATPLPQYAKGRKGGKAEHAIVGEIGQEAIVTTDGKVTLTPSTPSLAYIPQGADVIPHNELIKNSAYVALAKQGTVTTDKLQMALIAEFEKNTEEIKALHLTMKSKNLTATYNGLGGFESYKQANIR